MGQGLWGSSHLPTPLSPGRGTCISHTLEGGSSAPQDVGSRSQLPPRGTASSGVAPRVSGVVCLGWEGVWAAC